MSFLRLAIASAALLAATPAFATSTILCRSTVSPTDGPQLWLSVGNGPGSGVIQARLAQGGRTITTGEGQRAPVIGQSWLDRNSLRLTMIDANAENEILRLETWRRSGWSYFGTLRHGGRTWRVRCSEEG
jgi:hypothetical protein